MSQSQAAVLSLLSGGEKLKYVGSDYPQYCGISFKFHSYGYAKHLANIEDPSGKMLMWMPVRDLRLA